MRKRAASSTKSLSRATNSLLSRAEVPRSLPLRGASKSGIAKRFKFVLGFWPMITLFSSEDSQSPPEKKTEAAAAEVFEPANASC